MWLSDYWISKTRKNHSCGWCAKRIEAGSAAHYSTGIWEGDFFAQYMHPECAHVLAKMKYREIEDGWSPGDFARGRRDDDPTAPMQGSTTYKGFLVS